MLGNWIKQTTTTTGTGSLTLATVNSFPAFADQFAIGQPFYYVITDANGLPVETGVGRLLDGATLERTIVTQAMAGGVLMNTGASAVSLPAGTYTVACDMVMQQGAGAPLGFHSLAALRGKIPYPYVAAANTKALAANAPRVIAARIDSGRGISAFGVSVMTANGTAADKIRVGLYAILKDGDIGPLICESGDMRGDTTGAKSASIVGGARNVPPGWYYMAILGTAAPVLAAGSASVMAEVTPLGMASASIPISCATCATITAGWASMPTALTISSLTSLSTDFAPLPQIYQ